MSPNRPHRAQCCACCKTVTLRVDMNAWEPDDGYRSHLTGKLICGACEDDLRCEEHEASAEYCECERCERSRARAKSALIAREGATYGGLSADKVAILGLSMLLTDLGLAVEKERE